MCSEYVPARPHDLTQLMIAARALKDFYFSKVSALPAEEARIFPHGQAPIIVAEGEELHLLPAEFGLIPSWWHPGLNKGKSKSKRPLFATYNARLDTITEKKSFADPFRHLHCIVPIEAFFESSMFGEHFAGNRLRVGLPAGAPLLAAGIFSRWVDKETGEELVSFSIVTHDPPREIFDSGHDRCPVLFTKEDAIRWLGIEGADASKKFCLERNIAARAGFEISIDRALKPGWEKRAPSIAELDAVEILSGS